MEFKFRAADHPPPPPPPQPRFASSPRPPAIYCLSKQGFPDACLRRSTNIITMRKPFDTSEAMHCEMEMMRLREEKLLAEIERQRFLKEEARRELMLFEREMTIRGVAQSAGYSFREQNRWGARFSAAPAPSPAAVAQSFNEWQKVEQLKSSDRIGFGAVALPPRGQPFMVVDDKKERQVLQADKRELIVLEKPDPNVFKEKRKAEMLSTPINDIQPFGVKKNPKDEWSCALCQVTVSSERTFNHHLNGKKHKRKEAGLRAQKVSNVSQAAPPNPSPNKRRKLLDVTETSGSAGAEEKEPEVEECEKTEGSFDLNTIIPNFLKFGSKEEDKQQKQIVLEQNLMTEDNFIEKKKFKFWCGKCQVGAYATEVMFAHLNGKKHQANLQEEES